MTWSAGATLTAAQLNTHVPQTWTGSWAPTITAETGTFTSVSGAGRYIVMGKTVVWMLTITITTAGTAAGAVRFGLPSTAEAGSGYIGSGREAAATGVALTAFLFSTTQGSVLRYDNATIIASGRTLHLGGMYEAA